MANDLVINGVTYSGIDAIKAYDSNHNPIIMGASLQTFNINSYIEANMPSIYINNTVTYLKSFAFYNKSINKIYLPACTNVGAQCFYQFQFISGQALNEIYAPNLLNTGYFGFLNNEFTNISFPNCINIEAGAFQGCKKLVNIYIPKATVVGNNAFSSCTSLASISFPECSYIGTTAFSKCTYLTEATLTSIETICSSAFISCVRLSIVYLFNSSNSLDIQTSAFYYCTSLTSLYILCSYVITISNASVFYNTPLFNYSPYGSIFVPESLVSMYKVANGWSTAVFSSRFVGLTDSELNEIKTQVGIS